MWIDGSNSWDLHLCCNLNDLEIFEWATLSHLLSLVRIRPTSNTWIWPINPSLTFTVKFLMANLVGSVESPRKDLYSIVWKDHYPKKIKIFFWGLIALVLSIRLIGYKGRCLTCISPLLGPHVSPTCRISTSLIFSLLIFNSLLECYFGTFWLVSSMS